MKSLESVNDFVIKFANVNGTGSASANNLFAKALFRMGLPVCPKNIFPSNIQGLPTWYEVRVSEKGYLGRRGGVDIILSVNPQSMPQDIQGALAALLDIDFAVLTALVGEQFKGKEKLVLPNIHALELGHQYAKANFDCPIGIRVQHSDKVGDKILLDGNTALGLGALYGGASVVPWYPITPSTSVVDAFEKYAKRMRIDPGTGRKNYAIVQAEDELSAIGMVLGASWNGARSFTATSGPGLSLMSEFLGLAYFAEIPTVVIDVQRAGPSTGMRRPMPRTVIPSRYSCFHRPRKSVLILQPCRSTSLSDCRHRLFFWLTSILA
jgi:2-oxoglutarate ferredoxin oxidoreductase subunit alpha